jgi:hypothetical protein
MHKSKLPFKNGDYSFRSIPLLSITVNLWRVSHMTGNATTSHKPPTVLPHLSVNFQQQQGNEVTVAFQSNNRQWGLSLGFRLEQCWAGILFLKHSWDLGRVMEHTYHPSYVDGCRLKDHSLRQDPSQKHETLPKKQSNIKRVLSSNSSTTNK